MLHFAPAYPLIYRILNPIFPNCLWSGSPNRYTIALTFDDGPHPDYTPPLLAVLAETGVAASFFLLGSSVQRNPELTRSIYEQGHWIGLHGYTHRSFPLLSLSELQQSLEQTRSVIKQACGVSETTNQFRDVRPPNGLILPNTPTLLRRWGYRPVMWSIVPEDWVEPGKDRVIQRILRQVTNGALIVLHDGYYGGKQVSAIVAELIPSLRKQGYQFATIDQFWQLQEKS